MAIRAPTDPKLLESLLTGVFRLSSFVQKGDLSALRTIRNQVEAINEEILGKLPDVEYCKSLYAPVIYSSICDRSGMHASVFGFSKRSRKLPLHDHPEIHGFIKCLRGSLKIKSFSFHNDEELSALEYGSVRVQYEGEKILTPENGVAIVEPRIGNIHEIEAMEDGSFFFDLLIPEYGENPCTYFHPLKFVPEVGEVVEMELIGSRPPREFFCHSINYENKVNI